jgi:hypothetical protein
MGMSSIPSTGGIEIRSFKGFSLMGSHSVALISFAKSNIPHVFNLCLQKQLFLIKLFRKSRNRQTHGNNGRRKAPPIVAYF